nr:MAG TPA: hypothetical protein [Caudoviricetes sp.]
MASDPRGSAPRPESSAASNAEGGGSSTTSRHT